MTGIDDLTMLAFEKDPDNDDPLQVTGAIVWGDYYIPLLHEMDFAQLEKEGWQRDGIKGTTWRMPPTLGPFRHESPTRKDRILKPFRRVWRRLAWKWENFGYWWKKLIGDIDEDY